MPVQVSDRMARFFSEVFAAIVGTRGKDGRVWMNPVWFEFHDGYFWINSAEGRHWPRRLERDEQVTLLLIDPHDMYRWAQIQGRLVAASREDAAEHIDHLAVRYTGKPYAGWQPGMRRIKFKIEPLRINGQGLDG